MDASTSELELMGLERPAQAIDVTTRFVCLVKIDGIFRRVGEPGFFRDQSQLADSVRMHLPSDINWEVSIVSECAAGKLEEVSTKVLYEDALVLHMVREFVRGDDWYGFEGPQCVVKMLDDHTVYALSAFQLEQLQRVLGGFHKKLIDDLDAARLKKAEGFEIKVDGEAVCFRVGEMLGLVGRKLEKLSGKLEDERLDPSRKFTNLPAW